MGIKALPDKNKSLGQLFQRPIKLAHSNMINKEL